LTRARKEKDIPPPLLYLTLVSQYNIDSKHAIAHNKIMIIDKETVITGSFNFTKAAEEKNAENLLIIRNKDLANVYMENWYKHKEHSEPYER